MIKEVLESNNKEITKTYIEEYNHEFILDDIVHEYFEADFLECEPLAFIEVCEEFGLINEHINIRLLCACVECGFDKCLSFLYKKYDIDNVQFNYIIENYTLIQHDLIKPLNWVNIVTNILDNMNMTLNIKNIMLLTEYGEDVYKKCLEYKNHASLVKAVTLEKYIEIKFKGCV